MSFSGMDVDEIRSLGDVLQREADSLQRQCESIDHLLHSVEWNGRDAERFRNDRWPLQRSMLLDAAEGLRGLGRSARYNADDQERASSGESSSGLAGSPPPLVCSVPTPTTTVDREADTIDGRIPAGSHASTSDYIAEITHLRPGEIAIRQVGDDPPRYVVLLRGLDIWSAGSNDVPSTFADGIGFSSDYQRAINEQLARLPPDAEIAMIGHSQGGIAAVEVAQGDARISTVLTLGSPIDDVLRRPGLDVLSVVHSRDLVPKLDVPISRPREATFFTDIDPGDAHNIQPSYLPAVEQLEHSAGHPAWFISGGEGAETWISQFEDRFGGTGASGAGQLSTTGPGGGGGGGGW